MISLDAEDLEASLEEIDAKLAGARITGNRIMSAKYADLRRILLDRIDRLSARNRDRNARRRLRWI
jgi:hypothetical protein